MYLQSSLLKNLLYAFLCSSVQIIGCSMGGSFGGDLLSNLFCSEFGVSVGGFFSIGSGFGFGAGFVGVGSGVGLFGGVGCDIHGPLGGCVFVSLVLV